MRYAYPRGRVLSSITSCRGINLPAHLGDLRRRETAEFGVPLDRGAVGVRSFLLSSAAMILSSRIDGIRELRTATSAESPPSHRVIQFVSRYYGSRLARDNPCTAFSTDCRWRSTHARPVAATMAPPQFPRELRHGSQVAPFLPASPLHWRVRRYSIRLQSAGESAIRSQVPSHRDGWPRA